MDNLLTADNSHNACDNNVAAHYCGIYWSYLVESHEFCTRIDGKPEHITVVPGPWKRPAG